MTDEPQNKDPLREKIGPTVEVGGTEVGHGPMPWILIFFFVILMLWAAVSWIPPAGTY